MANKEQLARELYDAWNRRDYDRLADLVAPDGQIIVVGSGDTYEGPDGSRQYNKMWADGFPDGEITIDRVIATEDCAVVEFTGRGTHTGTLVTPMGSIPATGKSVTLQLCDVTEFDGDKVRSQRTYFDTGSLMAQLGLAQPAAAQAG
jgi:steroid delta-isomerase-like uncharacterized protein